MTKNTKVKTRCAESMEIVATKRLRRLKAIAKTKNRKDGEGLVKSMSFSNKITTIIWATIQKKKYQWQRHLIQSKATMVMEVTAWPRKSGNPSWNWMICVRNMAWKSTRGKRFQDNCSVPSAYSLETYPMSILKFSLKHYGRLKVECWRPKNLINSEKCSWLKLWCT